MSEEKKKFEKIAFIASPENHVQETAKRLTDRYGFHEPTEADAIVALGGDGLMLQTLHRFLNCRIPIYGIHFE
jgi:NAD+ kinase